MAWVKIEDGVIDNPKVARLSDRAFRMYICGIAHVRRHESDAIVTEQAAQTLVRRAKSRTIRELVEAGLWERTDRPDAYRIHHYHHYQQSRAEIEAQRDRAAAAGSAGGKIAGRGRPKAYPNATQPIGTREGEGEGSGSTLSLTRKPVAVQRYVGLKSDAGEEAELTIAKMFEDNPINEVWAHYESYHPRAKRSPKIDKLIKARLAEGYSVDDLKQATDGNHLDPHCSGENASGRTYHSASLIFRDSGHVTDYIEIAVEGVLPAQSKSVAGKMLARAAKQKEVGDDGGGVKRLDR